MHFFPKAWVAAGGGVDVGEALEDACLREIFEETGIKIDSMQAERKGIDFSHSET